MRTAPRQWLWLLVNLWFWGTGRALAQYDPAYEYNYKAGFLYQFVLQTTWSKETFADTNMSFVIGILGEDPWRGELSKKLRGSIKPGSSPQERKLEVKPCSNTADAAKCHLVFISKSEKPRLAQILDDLKDKKVFTVVEADKQMESDGVITLYFLDDKIKFVLNEYAAERANLKMGSQLKEVAANRDKLYRQKR